MNPFSKKPDTSKQPGVLLEMFAIRDTKAGYYNAPFYSKTLAEAERIFSQLANDQQTTVCQFPQDFDLYQVGQYDMDKGTVLSFDTPLHIVKAANLKKESPTPM